MLTAITTKEEAKEYRYGWWAGNPNGNKYDETRCAYEVQDNWRSKQCTRKNGKGINSLYCGQHAKMVMPHSVNTRIGGDSADSPKPDGFANSQDVIQNKARGEK